MAAIEKRIRNSKVSYRVRYRDPAGRQRSKSFARKVDAERWMIQTEQTKLTGSYINPQLGKTKFADLAERWWATTGSLRPHTRSGYRGWLDNHLLPTFGLLPVAAIDRLLIQEWIAEAVAAGTGAPTIRRAFGVLRLVLAAGVDGGLLAISPASRIRLPKASTRPMHVLTPAEIERLAEAICPPYGTLIRFAAWAGLRFGELAGLKVGRLDLLSGKVAVVETITQVRGKLHTGPPKSGESRSVRLPRFLCDELGTYLADRSHAPDDLVFTSLQGGPLRHSKFFLSFKAAVRDAELEPLRFHDLRHTAASLMIAQGTNVKVVQRQLGHKTAAMTLDVYADFFPDDVEELVERLDRARAAAVVAPLWPQRGPDVVEFSRKGH
jgi:integrase